ncbi:hypothetical protein [Streptomyces sp. MBT53]|uniref:hypothetical protein n=1 Tax=Streptomyces sp. MBT53 TaxID=1488384 RepID=UPI00191325E9|nr:hypothetical protein [Streptomyces sp. MBT53]MBK6017423.1 hypothetical protein [Streptomyces sp. MBT53]
MKLDKRLIGVMAAGLFAVGSSLSFATAAEAKPQAIPCAYGHICGEDGRGNSFDYYKCGITSAIDLYGPGAYNNNQTPGTVALLYDVNGKIGGWIEAQHAGYIDWTDIYFIKPC